MEISTTKEFVVWSKKIKAYTLMVGGKEVKVEKWWEQGMSQDFECDYAVENEKEIKELFSEEDWEEVVNYIGKLN